MYDCSEVTQIGEGFLYGRSKLIYLERQREFGVLMNGLKLDRELWAIHVSDLGLKVLDGGAYEVTFAPRAMVDKLLPPESLDTLKELVYRFAYTLARNCCRQVEGR